MTRFLATILLAAMALAAPSADGTAGAADTSPEAQPEATLIQFRDLFDRRGKPSIHSVRLNGTPVEMVGFMAPPPDQDSPFLVLVGVPTTFCPYCSTVNEHDHLPFVLVYPDEEIDLSKIGPRRRLRISGLLDAGHGHEGFYGIHNDVRITDAKVSFDQYEQRILPGQLGRKRAGQAGERVNAAELIDQD